MKLSTQAVGSIMLALQKGLYEQTDITDILLGFEVENSVDGLIVMNPPTFDLADIMETEVSTADDA